MQAVRRWNDALDGPLSETALRRRMEEAGYDVTRYTYPPGTRFPEHTHGVDKIDAVVSGNFELTLAGSRVVLGAGDWIAVPRDVPHSASVVGSEPVVSLDGIKRPRASTSSDTPRSSDTTR